MTDQSVSTPATVDRLACYASLLWISLRGQWIFFVVPMLCVATTTFLLWDEPTYRAVSLSGLVGGAVMLTIPVGLTTALIFRVAQYVILFRSARPSKLFGKDVARLLHSPSPLIVGLPLLVAMLLFNKGTLELKPMIPVINPFSWDVALMELDRALHFGIDPWRLLHPFVGYDAVTYVINMLYNFWFLSLFGFFTWYGFATRSTVNRTQFFLAYMLTWWIGGGLMAVAFSSAGPAYYSALGLTPDPYVPLLSYLHDVDSRIAIWALDAQQLLWDGYTGKVTAVGISAFPSMHTAMTLLFSLAVMSRSRGLGIAYGVYTVIILVGSVHLGWHYAVDGYAGLALAAVCWQIAGIAARWHHNQPETQRLNEGLARL
jgi:PAP2 superfamily